MFTTPSELNLKTVLVVADLVADVIEGANTDWRHDLEKSSLSTVTSILQAIESLGFNAIHISNLEELSARAALRCAGDIVLSIFGGEKSRNRMALVPAICESFGVRFIGPDVYGRIICQDKEISKRLAKQCGMITPWYRMVRNESDLDALSSISFPVVVKPSLEGSSIGITERCIATNFAEMIAVARELLTEFKQPIIIEQFIGGREVCINIIETPHQVEIRFAEIRVANKPLYFESHLFGAELKAPWLDLEIVPLVEGFEKNDIESALKLTRAIGHVGYCRIDGKLFNGRFHFLELTPDAWLDPEGAFALSFTRCGWSYADLLSHILASESASHRYLVSNG